MDRVSAAAKRRNIAEELLPALDRADLAAAGEAVFELQEIGSKRAEIDAQSADILQHLRALRSSGIECAFMSSLGPGIVTVSTSDTSARAIVESNGMEVVHYGRVFNRAAAVERSELGDGS